MDKAKLRSMIEIVYLILRLPPLAFSAHIVKSDYMNAVLMADVIDRVIKFFFALSVLRRHRLATARLQGGESKSTFLSDSIAPSM